MGCSCGGTSVKERYKHDGKDLTISLKNTVKLTSLFRASLAKKVYKKVKLDAVKEIACKFIYYVYHTSCL